MGIAEELADVLHSGLALGHGVGAAAGVIVDGERATVTAGLTSVEHADLVDSDTLFQVGSISKTFTATAVAALVDEGRVAFEDPVAKHLPELSARTGIDFDAITVEQLLSHQAGFDGDHLFITRHAESLDGLRGARVLFPPGAGFSYNNAGFSIAGEIVAAASGLSYETFVRTRLLQPLGMHSASFRADDAITYKVAAPHFGQGEDAFVIRRGGWQPGWELGPVDRAAGGLVASIEHLLTWCEFQWSGRAPDGSQLVTKTNLDRLHTPVVNEDWQSDGGLDWSVKRRGPVTTIDHGGLTVGYNCELTVEPEQRVGIVCLTNTTFSALLLQRVRRWALARVLGVDERDPEPDAALAIDPDRFTGRFLAPFSMLIVEVGDAPGTITITGSARDDVDGWQPPPEPRTTFGFFRADHAVSLDAATTVRTPRFGFDDAGRAAWVLWGSRRAVRVD
jgi:CubicO group peptidase (beta-lactamase class C family)